MINAAGQIVGNYRKTHLFGAEERRLFQPENHWLIHDIAGMRVGVLICFDVEFPEVVRSLADRGVELVAIPTANMFPYVHILELLVSARAAENQVSSDRGFIAGCDRSGTKRLLLFVGTPPWSIWILTPN